MKTTTIRMLGKGLTALCLLLLSHVGFAQTAGTAVTYTFNNFTETSANSFEYDLWVTNTGTTALNAKAFSFGLNCTANIGTLTHTYVPGSKDPAFNVITTYTV
ncbi:MAG TPA: hypothetical protein PLP14_06935, partial [Chitinophagaceae bacterium]|nr:hypothetical protein [Chitinophagaceae bacterium]